MFKYHIQQIKQEQFGHGLNLKTQKIEKQYRYGNSIKLYIAQEKRVVSLQTKLGFTLQLQIIKNTFNIEKHTQQITHTAFNSKLR